MKNGVDLHSYKPTAQDIAKIASADMIVYVGGESDEWIKDALEATPKKGRSEVNLMEALGDRVKAEEVVEGMEAEHHHGEHAEEHEHHEHHDEHADPSASSGTKEHHEHHDEHKEHAEEHHHHDEHKEHADPSTSSGTKEHHGEHAEEHEHHEHEEEVENDEHVWLSLKNAEILVQKIAAELAKMEPAHASLYTENANMYVTKLQLLDNEYRTVVENSSRKTILFGDRFPFRYMVDDYGIKYYAAFVGCSAESEASFETIAFLAGKMDSDSLPAIFTIEKGNNKIASAILAASKNSKNAEILTINSMQSVTEQQINEGIDYLYIMQTNLDVLKKALK